MATILVVDDQPANRDLAATLLGYRQHDVIEACDGAEALEIIRERHPDLVITDLLMPSVDGYELVRALRADPTSYATRVIYQTANYLLDEIRPVASALGVDCVLARPTEPGEFLAAVEAALAAEVASWPAPPLEDFHKEHLRALNTKLLAKVRELEATKAALEASEARLQSLADSAPIGIFSLDVIGMVAYGNPQLREICGLTTDPHSVDAWIALLHPDDQDRAGTALAAAIETRTPYRDRVRVIQPTGEQRWADIQAVPVAAPGDAVLYVGTVQDVTDAVEAQRKHDELETRLRSAERLESLGQLAAGIAHDFNNLLGAMLNYSDFISSALAEIAASASDPRLTQVCEDAAVVRTAIDRAADLTHQLLIFGRREIIHPEVLDVNELVREAMKLLSRTIGENIRLECRLAPGLRTVCADRSRLEQVIVNLVVNSRDAITGSGTVLVTTDNLDLAEQDTAANPVAEPGPYTRLTVSDDGAGMTLAVASHAFEPFYTTKPKGKGTGLGLATVHGIVSQLGGHAGIHSEPGHGTSVRVCLPSADGVPNESARSLPPAATGRGEAVLLVEDNDSVRTVTARILDQSGYRVQPACDGRTALSVLEDPSVKIDLLLSDMVMPGLSGNEVAARAAELRPGLPILFMSGYAAEFAGRPILAHEAVDLLEKPFTQEALLRRVAEALGRGEDPEG